MIEQQPNVIPQPKTINEHSDVYVLAHAREDLYKYIVAYTIWSCSSSLDLLDLWKITTTPIYPSHSLLRGVLKMSLIGKVRVTWPQSLLAMLWCLSTSRWRWVRSASVTVFWWVLLIFPDLTLSKVKVLCFLYGVCVYILCSLFVMVRKRSFRFLFIGFGYPYLLC